MLALGMLATLTANAHSGAAHGIAGMALAMWPGIAFVGSTEAALSMVRRASTQPGGHRASGHRASQGAGHDSGQPPVTVARMATAANNGQCRGHRSGQAPAR